MKFRGDIVKVIPGTMSKNYNYYQHWLGVVVVARGTDVYEVHWIQGPDYPTAPVDEALLITYDIRRNYD